MGLILALMPSENGVDDKLIKVTNGEAANESGLGATWAIGYNASMIIGQQGELFISYLTPKFLNIEIFVAHVPNTTVSKFHVTIKFRKVGLKKPVEKSQIGYVHAGFDVGYSNQPSMSLKFLTKALVNGVIQFHKIHPTCCLKQLIQIIQQPKIPQ